MDCNNVQKLLVNYLDDDLASNELSKFEAHIKTCHSCTKELKEYKELFLTISDVKMTAPSQRLTSNFNKLLLEEVNKNKVTPLTSKIEWKPHIRIAASILIIFSTFLLGWYQGNNNTTIASEINTKEKKDFLSLINSESASKRILAVENSKKFSKENIKIIEVIISKLFHDKNTNVRLAAAEALSKFSSLEIVKSSLTKALKSEDEPIIQIELIQILTNIQEKRALMPMKKLLENKDTPNYIKQELQLNITKFL